MSQSLAAKILHEQLKSSHEYMEQTMEGVTDQVAAFKPPHKANPIAGTYAHLLMSEDFFIHMLLQQKPPLFETDWKDKTGADSLQPTEWQTAYPKWLKEVKVDVKQMREYAQAVYKDTEDYVASLTDEDLEKEIDMSMFGMGKRPQATFIAGMILGHCNSIMGEISVLKGIQDLKGYPF